MKRLKRYFLYGLTVFLPVMLTVYLIIIIFNFADKVLGKMIKPIFEALFGFYFWGLSIVVFVLLILLIGFLTSRFFGQKLYALFERLVMKLPFFKQLYPATKEMAAFLFSRDKPSFKQVVLIEYPRKGIYSVGFLMNETAAKEICERTRQELCNVLIPTSPSPLTGFVVLVPKSEVIFTDIKIEGAIKFIVSDGVVNPA